MKTLLNHVSIIARDLPDLWFQAIYAILKQGRLFTIDKGSNAGQKRLEFDYFTGHITQPCYGLGTSESIPQLNPALCIPNPVELEYIWGGEINGEIVKRPYVNYLMEAVKEENEQYTYGERLRAGEYVFNGIGIDQIQRVISIYKKYGPRNNQMILQIAQPSDIMLDDPPCLRSIDTRIQNGRLHFFVYFRSWDLWGGMPANLAAIATLMEFMAMEIGVNPGEMIVESKGLHIYGYALNCARRVANVNF